jgi:hypothetical protein
VKQVLQTAALGVAVTLVAGCAYLALEILVLGLFDPKLGSPAANFGLGVYFLVITTGVEAAVFVVIGGLSGRRALLPLLSRIVGAITMAAGTIMLWPPKATSPIVMASLVSALALLAGSATSMLLALRGPTPQEKESVAGA